MITFSHYISILILTSLLCLILTLMHFTFIFTYFNTHKNAYTSIFTSQIHTILQIMSILTRILYLIILTIYSQINPYPFKALNFVITSSLQYLHSLNTLRTYQYNFPSHTCTCTRKLLHSILMVTYTFEYLHFCTLLSSGLLRISISRGILKAPYRLWLT